MTKHIHTHILELPFPPPEKDELASVMLQKIDEKVPVGHKLYRLVDKRNIGPDLGEDFQPCWRMEVTFMTEEIEPLVGHTVD